MNNLLRSIPFTPASTASPTSATVGTVGTVATPSSGSGSQSSSGSEITLLQQAINSLESTVQALTQALAQQSVSQSGSGQTLPNISLTAQNTFDLVPLAESNNVAANTNLLSFTPPYPGRALIFLQLATSSVANLVVTPSNGGTQSEPGAINSGNAIAANQPFFFDFPVSQGATYALQPATQQTNAVFYSVELIAK